MIDFSKLAKNFLTTKNGFSVKKLSS